MKLLEIFGLMLSSLWISSIALFAYAPVPASPIVNLHVFGGSSGGYEGLKNLVAWSPDGTKLAYASGAEIEIRDTSNWQPTILLTHRIDKRGLRDDFVPPYTPVAWSPDGRKIAGGFYDGTIKIWAASTGSLLQSFQANGSVLSLDWNPDGSTLALRSDKGVEMWDLSNSSRLSAPVTGDWFVVWSPEGDKYAIGTKNGILVLRLLEPIKVAEIASSNRASPAWSPDGTKLVSGVREEVLVSDASTGQRLLSLKHEGPVISVAWSPDGKYIASGSTQRVTEGGLAGFGGGVQAPNPNTLILWDASTGALIAKTKPGKSAPLPPEIDRSVDWIDWNSDGKYIAVRAWSSGVVIWSTQGFLLSALLWNVFIVCVISASIGTAVFAYKYPRKPKGQALTEGARK